MMVRFEDDADKNYCFIAYNRAYLAQLIAIMSWSTSFTDTGESDKCDPADGMEEDSIDDVLKQLFDVINMSMNDLLRIVDKKYRILWNAIKSKNLIFPRWLESLIFWPFTIMYALYVRLPLLLLGHVSRHLILFVQVACRRSRLISRLLLHVAALCKIGNVLTQYMQRMTANFVLFCSEHDCGESGNNHLL